MLARAHSLAGELIRLRRDIHQHPELGFREYRTAALVADTLQEIGVEVQTGVGRTGVVGQLSRGHGPTIAIRADMDALPIVEQTGAAYSSRHEGVMHACGHDAHTAMLLGAAHLLKQSLAGNDWQGSIRFLFQPSEEAFDEHGVSGATAMLAAGALEGVEAIISLHVISDLPAGQFYFQDGYSMAAVDSFEAWLKGDGGHGAYPHTGVDPIYMLSLILPHIYGIQSRRINPLRPSVVSVGQIRGGTASNVIPREVYLQGTIRAFDEETRQQLREELEQALRLSQLMGGSYRLQLQPGYPPLYNDPEANRWLMGAARDLLGETAVHTDHEFGMGAEDFAYMTQQAKGAMFMLGAAIDDGVPRHHHTEDFDIDESVLPLGAAILAETARRFVTGQLA